MTKAPIEATIQVHTDISIGSEEDTYLGSGSSSGDGTFNFKIYPSDAYYVFIEPPNDNGESIIQPHLSRYKTTDLGTILSGTYTFYCKIKLVPVTNSAISVGSYGVVSLGNNLGNNTPTSYTFNAGTSTQVLISQTYGYGGYNYNKNCFPIFYTTYASGVVNNGMGKDSTIFVPAPNQDTLSVTINY